MSSLQLPPGEPPAALVAEAWAELVAVRQELRDAAHVIALIRINGPESGGRGPLYVLRREVELQVAEVRLQLWSSELRQREAALRRMGIRP